MIFNKYNKKGELRLQHVIIAVLVMSLFGIMLFSATTNFITEHSNLTSENLTTEGREGNRTGFLNTVNNLNNMSSELLGASKSAPGGIESAISSSESDSEGSIVKAGFAFIANIGNWVFKYPKMLISGVLGFLGLPQAFTNVATTILIVVVVIILISSILKNRL